MKLDENICILPRCEEPILLVDRMEVFCVEHRKRFYDYFSSYEVSSEVDNMLKIDEEFRNKFLTDMFYDFCYEEIEEGHKNNTFSINKKKQKTRKRQKKKRRK